MGYAGQEGLSQTQARINELETIIYDALIEIEVLRGNAPDAQFGYEKLLAAGLIGSLAQEGEDGEE